MKTLAALFLGAAALTAAAEDLPPLNSPATTDFFPGKFVWGDLFTADPATTGRFYTELFGWTATTIQRATASGIHPYIVLSNEGRPIAGIALLPMKMKDEVHGRWVGYVSVPDVAQALAAATAAGGHVLFPAKDLAKRGTQAIITDADGATLGVIHSSAGDPAEYLPDPGDWTWAELFARYPNAAGLFYHNVIGYEVMPDTRTDQPKNLVMVSGGYSRASVAPVPDRPKAHPVWLLFVRVASVNDTVAQAVRLGGKVLVGPSDTLTEYWRAIIADPAGAAIGVVQIGRDSSAPKKQP
jgi:predicted enzyme related to lactoylglutathione lyase